MTYTISDMHSIWKIGSQRRQWSEVVLLKFTRIDYFSRKLWTTWYAIICSGEVTFIERKMSCIWILTRTQVLHKQRNLRRRFFGDANIFTYIQSHLNLSPWKQPCVRVLFYFKHFCVCVVVASPTVSPSNSQTRISAPINPKSRGWNTSHAHPTTSSTRALRQTERNIYLWHAAKCAHKSLKYWWGS